jgi:hypothetical protein
MSSEIKTLSLITGSCLDSTTKNNVEVKGKTVIVTEGNKKDETNIEVEHDLDGSVNKVWIRNDQTKTSYSATRSTGFSFFGSRPYVVYQHACNKESSLYKSLADILLEKQQHEQYKKLESDLMSKYGSK